MTRSMDI